MLTLSATSCQEPVCLLQNCQGKVRQANFSALLCVDCVPTLWTDLSSVTFCFIHDFILK